MEQKKFILDAIYLGFAFLGGLIALYQWRRDQSWKKADKLDALFKEFEGNRLIQIACRVMDWSRGNFKFSDGEELRFNTEDVKKSLVLHGDKDLTFTQTQARMRDAYDSLISFFERLETSIETGLIDKKSALRLFGYWIRHFARMPEHEDCDRLVSSYILNYANITSFIRLYRRT